MSFNPFSSVSDYPSMLNKIATWTFGVGLLAMWFLRQQSQVVDHALSPYTVLIPVASGLALPLGTVLPAFLVAFLSRVTKLHDRISDIFRIRARFDVEAILLPLALGSGAHLDGAGVRRVRTERKLLMGQTFYKYASSGPNQAAIDPHYITMSLDQWSWYWIVSEATTVFIGVAVILFLAADWKAAAFLLVAGVFGFGLLAFIRHYCVEYAQRQVELVLQDHIRRNAIRQAFDAL